MDDDVKNLADNLDRNLVMELQFDQMLGSCPFQDYCSRASKLRQNIDRMRETNIALRNAIAAAFLPDATIDDMRKLAMLAGLSDRAHGARVPIQRTEAHLFTRFRDLRTRYGRREDPMSELNDSEVQS